MTIKQALSYLEKELTYSSDSPHLDAQWLLLHILKKQKTGWLLTNTDYKLDQEHINALEKLLTRRRNGEPLAYLMGEWEFYGRKFNVNQDVLIPRPSTESIIDKAIPYIEKIYNQKNQITVADIGTGSGCIIITLALELFRQPVFSDNKICFLATDISNKALDVAKKNAIRHSVKQHITFLPGNMLEPIKDRQTDLVVSNPPYLPSNELQYNNDSAKKGLQFEPPLALNGGKDGQKYVSLLMKAGIPAIIETTNGEIIETI